MKRVGLMAVILSLVVSQTMFIVPVNASEDVLPPEDNQEVVQLGADDLPVDDSRKDTEHPDTKLATELADKPKTVVAVPKTSQSVATDTIPVAEKLLISKVQVGLDDNTGAEFIEIYNPSPEKVLVDGWSLEYLKAGFDGNKDTPKTLVSIKNLELVGHGFIVVANASYLGVETGHVYAGSNVLYQNGTVRLMNDGEMIDMVGWGGAKNFLGAAATAEKYGAIERCANKDSVIVDTRDNKADFAAYDWGDKRPALGLIANCVDSDLDDDEDDQGDDSDGELPDVQINSCEGLRLSEIATNVDRQFVEVYNYSQSTVDLTGCRIESERQKGAAIFGEIELEPNGYEVIYLDNSQTLSLYKGTYNTVYLLSSDGKDELDAAEYKDLKEETSLSLIDSRWQQTYVLTPGQPNQLELHPSCGPGKERNVLTGYCVNLGNGASGLVPCAAHQFRNPETNRCNNKTSAIALKPCRADQFRNPQTNRCNNLATKANALVPCKVGQERNPETNRCRKIGATGSQLKPCQPGYERNPETNRCRKDRNSLGEVAGYAVEPVADSAQSTIGWWAFGGVALLAAGYGTWEWRREIARLIRGATHLGRH